MSWERHGIVKQVISGNLLIVRDSSGGQVAHIYPVILMNIICTRLAEAEDSPEEPFAWEAREFLRLRYLGRNVAIKVHRKLNDSFLSTVYLANGDGKVVARQSINEEIAASGFVWVREVSGRDSKYPEYVRLLACEESARSGGRGRFSSQDRPVSRSLRWTVGDPARFVEETGGKELKAIVEGVKSASVLRVLLVDSWTLVDVILAGISCPICRKENSDKFAEEAKFFVECRLLQRQVTVVLEGVTRSGALLCSVRHPMGNISLRLLQEGFAKTFPPCSSEFLKAEQAAKSNQLRLWADHRSSESPSFRGFVFDIIGAEGLVLRKRDRSYVKLYFSGYQITNALLETKARTSYSVPFVFEARQLLRELVLGKMVSVTVDSSTEGGEGRTLASVYINSINVAARLLEMGFGFYRHSRLSFAGKNELMFAEKTARGAKLGVHGESPRQIVDLTDNAEHAKSQLPLFRRMGRTSAVVDRIQSGSRMSLFLGSQRINFVLYGITTSKISGLRENEEFGLAALELMRERSMGGVNVRVLGIDKYGGFVGWMDVGGVDVSLALLEAGLAWVGSFYSEGIEDLREAQERAKLEGAGIWANLAEKPRDFSLFEVSLSYIDKAVFYMQRVVDLSVIENLMRDLNPTLKEELEPLPPSRARGNTTCVIRAVHDSNFYRAKILSADRSGVMRVSFIDYGFVESSSLRPYCLPTHLERIPPMAIPCRLAFVDYPEDSVSSIVQAMASQTRDNCFINIEIGGAVNEVLLYTSVDGEMRDFGLEMVRTGLCTVREGISRKFHELVAYYWEAQRQAMLERLNIWEFSDAH